MPAPQKILAIKLRAIGDTVIWTAALQALRDAYPAAQIHVLTYASNAAVLEHHPAVNVRHFLKTKSAFDLARILLRLRAERFDWLLGFHATTSLCRWGWLTDAKTLALHHHSWSYTPRGSVLMLHAGDLEDAITRDHRVLEAVGILNRAPTHLWITPAESAAAERRVRDEILTVGGNPELKRFAFLPGAGHHLRRLPKDMWLPLAEQVLREGTYQPVVIVDRTLSEELDLRKICAERGLPLLDRGSLREFITYVARAERALANDSGPGHIAVAVGLKTSFVFGPGCVGDWHPYDRRIHPLFRVAVDCRLQGPREREEFQFCTVDVCEHHRCMRQQNVSLDASQIHTV